MEQTSEQRASMVASIGTLHFRIREAQHASDRAILATPTGEPRNKLTEANLHLMQALNAVEAADEAL